MWAGRINCESTWCGLTIAKSCLIELHLLSLVYKFDLSNFLFFIKSYKTPQAACDIINNVSFATGNIQLSIHHRVRSSDNTSKNFYFNELPRLWNYLSVVNTETQPSHNYKEPLYIQLQS